MYVATFVRIIGRVTLAYVQREIGELNTQKQWEDLATDLDKLIFVR